MSYRLQEEKQRALLQMQWRVMSDKQPEEQEVSSRKVRPQIILIHQKNTVLLIYIITYNKKAQTDMTLMT